MTLRFACEQQVYVKAVGVDPPYSPTIVFQAEGMNIQDGTHIRPDMPLRLELIEGKELPINDLLALFPGGSHWRLEIAVQRMEDGA